MKSLLAKVFVQIFFENADFLRVPCVNLGEYLNDVTTVVVIAEVEASQQTRMPPNQVRDSCKQANFLPI